MPKLANEEEVIRVSLFVYKADWRALDHLTTSEMNKSALARRILHTYVTQAGARIRAAIDRTETASQAEADANEAAP
jgi:hypothetical protein